MKKREPSNSTALLRGVISGLERSRRSHNLILTELQHQQVGAAAIAASAMGMGAAGAGLIGMAGNSDEEADWVEFEIDGKKITGWLWMMPMRNGDKVEVVAERIAEDLYVAYAVKRDGDELLAVYPHATSGRKVHYRRSLKIWLWCSLLLYLMLPFMFLVTDGVEIFLDVGMVVTLGAILIFWMVMSGFVEIAEEVFRTFGWPNVENIDLRRTSREHRRGNKPPNFGNLYFRYK
ncbi:putative type VI secretion system effector [Trinickia caryophylli]|uniref:Uncharacterized protein n=1 Tax=Trinickia caryophylli TaxID=28094 RepID=A0A1X7F557_TRICW|nr:putative type VI secretion system effector [Trinickia caryophylli]PMS10427.1 hypothetical protein C0Z17_20275 [Trinickia caryophylli]TRX19454.1 hypothetical protein FNF07_15310 [Trinickia caryophylli]WQE13241.1 putative type VI secretion system effector [Trinickia caryophylli]SMF45499.1 hypothetical protein SAMN06295900_107125 [Trinickia caryophylli]GLU34445.1 hypothetical protein Busp01_42870 [Trinickia caryophylli]